MECKKEKIGNITLFNADCIDIMKQYEDNYFDLAIVDPDFGLNEKISKGGTWANKYKGFDGALGGKPTQEYFNELFRVSKNQIIWGGNYFLDMFYPTRCFLIWDKKPKMPTLADCEMAWTSFDKNAKIFVHPRNTAEKRIHICQKPIALYDWILENYGCESCKILDTHLGSGSSAIASHKHNFEFVGCEINQTYFEEAIKRIKSHISQKKLF